MPKTPKTTDEPVGEPIGYKTRTTIPDHVKPTYADGFHVVNTGAEFVLSFTQAQIPIFREDDDLSGLNEIPAECFVRVVMSPFRMQELLVMLNRNFQEFLIDQNSKQAKE